MFFTLTQRKTKISFAPFVFFVFVLQVEQISSDSPTEQQQQRLSCECFPASQLEHGQLGGDITPSSDLRFKWNAPLY